MTNTGTKNRFVSLPDTEMMQRYKRGGRKILYHFVFLIDTEIQMTRVATNLRPAPKDLTPKILYRFAFSKYMIHAFGLAAPAEA
jgi:hypothetical protein